MNSILLPPGSSELEKRLAAACASISGLDVTLRDLWNPWRCPAQFLPYLAWAFSVDRWEETWSEDAKRKAVSDSFWIHKRKGTVAAVRRVIEALGYLMTVKEWWSVGDAPGTFRLDIDLNGMGITETMNAELERIIGDAKPVSRHISQLIVSSKYTCTIWAGISEISGDIIAIYPPDYEPDDSIYYDGVVRYDANYRYSGA